MKLIIGLGNPGKEYEHTRHNVGFDTIDLFADSLGTSIEREGFKGLYEKTKYFDEVVYLLKPQTFMNLSGESVRAIMDYFKIDVEDIIVIHDDMDFEPGNIKLKTSGSSAGHNGIKSIISNVGTQDFKRIRIGIGKPTFNSVDYVLGRPQGEEFLKTKEAEENVVKALKVALKESFNKAMTEFN